MEINAIFSLTLSSVNILSLHFFVQSRVKQTADVGSDVRVNICQYRDAHTIHNPSVTRIDSVNVKLQTLLWSAAATNVPYVAPLFLASLLPLPPALRTFLPTCPPPATLTCPHSPSCLPAGISHVLLHKQVLLFMALTRRRRAHLRRRGSNCCNAAFSSGMALQNRLSRTTLHKTSRFSAAFTTTKHAHSCYHTFSLHHAYTFLCANTALA